MSDRRAGKRTGPFVGKQPRSKITSRRWKKKKSDAGKPKWRTFNGKRKEVEK